MRILVIGNGGREHAIAWKLAQSEEVERLYVAPGNSGAAKLARSENVPLRADDLRGLRDFALQQGISLAIVGPEAPLTAGVVDLFQAAGLKVFGPTRAAAQIEGSKAFSKHFMQRYGIPTGQAEIFTDFDAAMGYLRALDDAPVVKASGLAAGKGVILPETQAEAAAILRAMLLERSFGPAGETVLLEERLEGPELSVLAFCDGKTALIMPAAQDHKRLLDGDHGPNTGGMGAFAPSPLATPQLLGEIEREILSPALAGMAAEGAPYMGVLYAGLMLTKEGPKVLEFNCRLGDPEAQAVLPLLESDLAELCLACVEGRLEEVEPSWRKEAAVSVVMASAGYPGEYATELEISGVREAEERGCLVFHAGATWKGERLLTAGGRVLAVTALGNTLPAAVENAYAGVAQIHFNGAYYRKDIGRGLV
jgi:phosphoribosylamine--glycine ligase